MTEPYGVAIVGTGWVAGRYVDAVGRCPATELVGVAGREAGRGAAFLRSLGVPGRGYGSLDEALGDADVDIVVSATPPDTRREHVIRAADAGKHVVIEKPPGLTAADVDEMRAAVAANGVRSVTSFVVRWNPRVEAMKALLRRRAIGDLVYAECDYWNLLPPSYEGSWIFSKEVGGSAVLAAGHAVDMLRHLAGEVAEVAAVGSPARLLRGLGYPPTVVATARLRNGAVARTSTILEAPGPHVFNVRLIGTAGTIDNERVHTGDGDVELPGAALDHPGGSHPFDRELEHFARCIDEGRESHASIHDTWRTMQLCFAIDESVRRNGSWIEIEDP